MKGLKMTAFEGSTVLISSWTNLKFSSMVIVFHHPGEKRSTSQAIMQIGQISVGKGGGGGHI